MYSCIFINQLHFIVATVVGFLKGEAVGLSRCDELLLLPLRKNFQAHL